MKKRLISIFGLILCLVCALSFSANANHLEYVDIIADCEGYKITGTAVLHYGEFQVTFSSQLTYNGKSIIVEKTILITNTIEALVNIPFTIIDSWEELCEDAVLEQGTLTLNRIEGTISHTMPLPVDPIYIYDCPCENGEGCTPGFWKQRQHFNSWTSYAPSNLFSTVFEDAFPGKTLLDVLKQGGGGLNALGRHTIAALLNAASTDVSYDLSVADVINKFNAVFPGGDYETLKDEFEDFNQQGCPLD
jgi:hypothetical protein